MRGSWRITTGGLLCLCMATVGCGQNNLPFAAKYISRNRAVVSCQGKNYTLDRYGVAARTPFQYRFEPDGDLNLFIDGREYDVDSPYDIDRKKSRRNTTTTKSAKNKRLKKRQ